MRPHWHFEIETARIDRRIGEQCERGRHAIYCVRTLARGRVFEDFLDQPAAGVDPNDDRMIPRCAASAVGKRDAAGNAVIAMSIDGFGGLIAIRGKIGEDTV